MSSLTMALKSRIQMHCVVLSNCAKIVPKGSTSEGLSMEEKMMK